MQKDSLFTKRFLEGDSNILQDVYTNSYPFVERYIVTRNGTKKDAEDIFHNALLLIYVKLKEEKIVIKKFEHYLFTVCKNLWRRENAKKRVTNLEAIPLVSEEVDMATFYLEHQQWELYQEKFKKLSDSCQEILKMVFQKKTYQEIVKHFSYNSETVARQRVFKCKTRLIQLIKQDKRYFKLK